MTTAVGGGAGRHADDGNVTLSNTINGRNVFEFLVANNTTQYNISGPWKFANNLTVAASLLDSTGYAGGTGQVLISSGAGTVTWGLYYGPTVAPTQTTLSYPVNNLTLNKVGSVSQCFTNVALTSSTALSNVYPLGQYYWATAAGAFSPTSDLADHLGKRLLPGAVE